MTVPYPNISQNITSLPDLFQRASEISQGEVGMPLMLGYVLLLVFTLVALIGFRSSFKEISIEKLLPSTFFISYISAVFLSALKMLPPNIPAISLVIFIISIGLLFYKEK